MTFDHENAVKELQAKDEIRDLVFSYCEAICNRDIELLVGLYTPDAAFGSMGTGEEALRSMAEATMGELEFAVILVTNHRITFLNECEAKGEVWARCYAQNKREGYYEQIIKYTDQYELSKSQNRETASWKFKHRRHHLWFGQSKESPLTLPPADWPKNNIGLGRELLSDEAIQNLRE
ncbi:MAG: nuclear transport factor 2 family protein [Acidimicrobiales bacterium]|nr:nuclear transport factor 2 family protein [Acidimicrobiales bacterium]